MILIVRSMSLLLPSIVPRCACHASVALRNAKLHVYCLRVSGFPGAPSPLFHDLHPPLCCCHAPCRMGLERWARARIPL